MKRLLAFLTAFAVIAIAGATLNIAQANSNSAPEITTTPSSTFTLTPTETSESPTATETATATDDPCPPPPPAPELIAPKHQAVIKNKVRIKLRWSKVDCANKYRILVRRGSRTGEPAARGHTGKAKAFVELDPGYTYFWNIKACIKKRCTRSVTNKFTLPAPPTPTPTYTPRWTNTPRPQTPAGTPIPGNPPRVLNDYKGPSVYLNSDPSPLYYFDCSFKWPSYPKGFLVHTLTLWFYPNEWVSYESRTLPGALVEKGTLRANSEGYVEYTFDTSSWPGDHYHMTFTGQSSKVLYCGHIQVTDFGASTERGEHGPHTQQELDDWQHAAESTSE